MTTSPSPTTEQQIQAMIEQAGRLYQLLQMESEHLSTLRQETDQQMQAIHALKDQIQQDLAKNLSKGVELGIKHALEGSKNAITDVLSEKIGGSTTELQNSALNANQAASRLEKASSFEWTFIYKLAMTCCSLLLVGLLVIIAVLRTTPSLHEIEQRKQTLSQLNQQGASAQVGRCDGQVCIRVIKDQCGYGQKGDFCVISNQ